MKKIFTFLAVACAITIAGCAPTNPKTTSPSPTAEAANTEPASVGVTVGEATVKLDEDGKRYWYVPDKSDEEQYSDLLTQYELQGIEGVPSREDVPFISYYDEDGENWYQCMASLGFPWNNNGDNGHEISVDPDQDLSFRIASYRCDLMHPQNPEDQHPPMNESQVSYYYDWQIGPARTCYEEHGYPVEDPPSKQVFIDDWFDNMKFDTWFLGDYAPNDMEFVNKTCPWSPPDIWEH